MTNLSEKSQELLNRIYQGETIISDGGTGTYLQKNGLEPGGCPEEFNVSHPEVIKKMAREYFEAGSDMVLTNSFGGSVFRQKHYGFEDSVFKFNKLAAQLAKSQAPEHGFVCGSLGPTGEFLLPLGLVSNQEMYDSFKNQALALEEGGADCVVIETMLDIDETSIAIQAVRENTSMLAMATMTFDLGPRGFFTMMGVTPEDAAKKLEQSGAQVIGANCGNGIERMIEIASKMRNSTDQPMMINCNAGIPSLVSGEILYPETPEYMAEQFMKLKDVGVNIIGGCCGTGPEHIKALSDAINK
ncbi:MAG: methionine synthase [Chloroflexi bacterium]|nr:methionine synthase [Chloroflexota bacterium]